MLQSAPIRNPPCEHAKHRFKRSNLELRGPRNDSKVALGALQGGAFRATSRADSESANVSRA
eukprot:5059410-Alexandrium_andersonii.AAC.1